MSAQNTPKQLLILKCSTDVCDAELLAVTAITALHQIETTIVDVCAGDDLIEKAYGKCFSLIYLCGHGNINSLCNEQGNCVTWSDIASALCQSACTQPNSTLFCACCRGGLQNVATSFFSQCTNLGFLCGPRADTYPSTLTLGFHVFLYNFMFKLSDAETAAEAASHATGYKFQVHDRQTLLDAQLCAVRGDANES